MKQALICTPTGELYQKSFGLRALFILPEKGYRRSKYVQVEGEAFMRQAMIISNPSSGKEEAQQYVSQVQAILESQQYQVMINETAGVGDATSYCLDACQGGCDLVISIGETAHCMRPLTA